MKLVLAALVGLLMTSSLPSIAEVPIQYGRQFPAGLLARAQASCDTVPMMLVYGPGDTAHFTLITNQPSACTVWAIYQGNGQGLKQ